MEKLKIILVRFFMRFFWIFPVQKKKFFFSSYEGKQFSCNPKTLFVYLRNLEIEGLMCVYEYNLDDVPLELKSNEVITVKHNSFKYMFHIMTSEYLITNSGISCCFPVRKKQINVNTWHGGGAYKKVGFASTKKIHGGDLYGVYVGSKQTTYFLSSSNMFTKIMMDSLKLRKEQFLEIGMPRNDIFFIPDNIDKLNRKVRNALSIKQEEFVVLYAPTYRGTAGNDNFNSLEFNIKQLSFTLQKKYNKDVRVLVRMHYFNKNNNMDENVVNVSSYPDMQDLLVVADMLITDYSSSIWDYSFTGRPCHLLVTDAQKFINDRGLYTNINTWPGIIALSATQLYENITKFDEENYKNKIANHHKSLGNYDIGTARNNFYKIIVK